MRRLPDLEELAGCRSWLIVIAALIPLHQELVEEVGGCLGFSVALPDDVDRGVASHIQAVNPVGSGDTLMGAFAVALERTMDDACALAFAMAAATANCLSPATGNFDPQVAQEVRNQVKVHRLA